MFPQISRNPEIQAHYEASRLAGTSHSLAEMFATGQTPALMTDSVFLEGRGGCYDQFKGQAEVGDFYEAKARAAGVDTTGRVYLSGLAAYPGDPRAWISGRGDAQRLCEERGWACEGAVKVKGRPREDVWGEYEPAPDLVEARAQDLLASNQGLSHEVATEQAREQISPVRGGVV